MNKSVTALFGTKTKALQSFTDCFAKSSVPPKFKKNNNILQAPRNESETIRIETLTSVSCSVRFEVFSCDSCFAGKNSDLLQIEIKVFSRFHRVCLLNSTIATCFRRIQAKFDRFYSIFDSKGLFHVHTSAILNFAHIHYIRSKISLAKLDLS